MQEAELSNRNAQQWNSGKVPDRVWRPYSFMDRGVAIPFTTPLLAGARARHGERGLEAVVPHPAGARGVYIVAWSGLEQYCGPTLHDLRLAQLISGEASLVPPSIRRVARQVAAEGFAGRRARATAEAAITRDVRSRLLMRASLLKLLVEQVDGTPVEAVDLEARARSCLLRVAMQQSRAAEAVLGDVQALSNLIVDHGMADEFADDQGRSLQSTCKGLLVEMERMEAALRVTARRSHTDAKTDARLGDASSTNEVANTLRLITACSSFRGMGNSAVVETRHLLSDMQALFGAWVAQPDRIAALVSRADWLLDGWREILLQWEHAPPRASCGDLINELAGQVPALPVEARCHDFDSDDEGDLVEEPANSNLGANSGAAMFDRVAQNERMRASAA